MLGHADLAPKFRDNSKLLKSRNGIELRSYWIPVDYENSELVFFVDSTDGESYGSFLDYQDALREYNVQISNR